MIKLNIGAGFDIKPTDKGWVNIDGNANDGVNHVMDLTNDAFPYPDNSVDHILAQNIIEHISRHDQEAFVVRLYKMLKVGGTITIEMPNLKAITERYLGLREDEETLTTFDAAAFLFGAQEDEFGCHRWIYDMQELDELLNGIGFVSYYTGEIRGTNIINKAIKSDADNLQDAFFDCALSNEYRIVKAINSKVALVVAGRLAEFGRVFCFGDFPQFEHENLIVVPEYVDIPRSIIRASSACVIDVRTHGDAIELDIARVYNIPAINLADDLSIDCIMDGLHGLPHVSLLNKC